MRDLGGGCCIRNTDNNNRRISNACRGRLTTEVLNRAFEPFFTVAWHSNRPMPCWKKNQKK
jgi:hypothetical protein